ncbi:hypothetical protein RPSD_52640 (plasmid) [Ralstonia solanacearum]|nr:hypothetical protein RPSD_52640 [Ralstonia solanacearum]
MTIPSRPAMQAITVKVPKHLVEACLQTTGAFFAQVRELAKPGLRAPLLGVAAALCLWSSAATAACVTTESLPGLNETTAPRAGSVLGVSLPELLDGRPEQRRETEPSDTLGQLTTVYLSPHLWVTAEGSEAQPARFSLTLISPDTSAQSAADARQALAVIANAFGARTLDPILDVVVWHGQLVAELRRQAIEAQRALPPSGRNLFFTVQERGPYRVTAYLQRLQSDLTLCFEPKPVPPLSGARP